MPYRNRVVECLTGALTGLVLTLQKFVADYWEVVEIVVQGSPDVEKGSMLEGQVQIKLMCGILDYED